MNKNNDQNKATSKSEKSKKLKDFNLYDIEKASNTFQKIITRYRKKKYHFHKKPMDMVGLIEKARFKAEKLETHQEFMMKELKNNIRIEQELIALFGPRAKKHYNELSNKKFNSKINKYDFFTPTEIKYIKKAKNTKTINKKKTEPNSELSQIVFKRRRINFSPTIMSKNKTNFFNTYSKDLKSSNASEISTKFKSFYKTSTKLKKYKKFNPYQTFDGNDNSTKILEDGKEWNRSISNKKYLNTDSKNFRERGRNFPLVTLSKNVTNKDFSLDKMAYLDELIKLNKQFVKKEKNIKNHFRNNDYGCAFSKMEYRYLTKKYFN